MGPGTLPALRRGLDDREVEPNRIRKSLSNERTFGDLLTTLDDCRRELDELISELLEDLRVKSIERPIHKAFVKVKFADFTPHHKRMCQSPTHPRNLSRPPRRSLPAQTTAPSASSAPVFASSKPMTMKCPRSSCWRLG